MLFFYILLSSYIDITVDTKSRVLLLSSNPARVEILDDTVNVPLDSLFNPTSLTSAPFSVWVASLSAGLIQKYSLRGEYLGSISIRANDIDADRDGLLIAGERSLLVELSTGREIPINFQETSRCALCENSIYLYGNDTLYVYRRPNQLKQKRYIPGIQDIAVFNAGYVFLRNDSLITNDTIIFIPSAKRMDSNGEEVWVLTDSAIRCYPEVK